jgi:bacillithiol biosynthesis deacetylase BshB1
MPELSPVVVLAFGAHPDDVEIGVGGILRRLTAAGVPVGVADLSRGERSNNGTPEERAAEARAAAAVLGLAWRANLGLPDTGIGGREQTEALVAVLRQARPRLVLAPCPEDRHPDHRGAGELAAAACFLSGVAAFGAGGAAHRPARLAYYQLNARRLPDWVVDVSDYFEDKRRALQAHRSQFVQEAGRRPTSLNGAFLEELAARDRYLGSLVGVTYGEGLYSSEAPERLDPEAWCG